MLHHRTMNRFLKMSTVAKLMIAMLLLSNDSLHCHGFAGDAGRRIGTRTPPLTTTHRAAMSLLEISTRRITALSTFRDGTLFTDQPINGESVAAAVAVAPPSSSKARSMIVGSPSVSVSSSGKKNTLRSKSKAVMKATALAPISVGKAVVKGSQKTGKAVVKGSKAMADAVVDTGKSVADATGKAVVGTIDATGSAIKGTGKAVVGVTVATGSAIGGLPRRIMSKTPTNASSLDVNAKSKWELGVDVIDRLTQPESATYEAMTEEQRLATPAQPKAITTKAKVPPGAQGRASTTIPPNEPENAKTQVVEKARRQA